jgi:hypothetical protein
MIVQAEVSCPWCGEYFALAIDTSEGDFDTIVDCEVCCRPMEITAHCEPGEVIDVQSGRA